jgi:hypothetical protein
MIDSFDLDSGIGGMARFNGGLLNGCACPKVELDVAEVGESSNSGGRSRC